MNCTVTRHPLADSFRARLRAARIEAVFSNDHRTELEQLLRCNVAADPFDPNQPDPPRVAPLPARDGGAPCVSPPARRATHFPGDVIVQDYRRDVAALAAAGFVIVLALLAYTILGGQ